MFKNGSSRKNDGGVGIKKDEAETIGDRTASVNRNKSFSYILKKTIKTLSF